MEVEIRSGEYISDVIECPTCVRSSAIINHKKSEYSKNYYMAKCFYCRAWFHYVPLKDGKFLIKT